MTDPLREVPLFAEDSRWGRWPGARPPLPVWGPAAFAAVLALVLTLVVVLVVRPPGPLDQVRLGDQRNGLLRDGPVVAAEVGGVVFGAAPVVLLFLRQAEPEALRRWAAQVPDRARVVAVVQADDATATGVGDVDVVADPGERIADSVALPTPNGGGPGVGYAVVDSDRVVRYSTLDPMWLQNAFEVATIVGSVP